MCLEQPLALTSALFRKYLAAVSKPAYRSDGFRQMCIIKRYMARDIHGNFLCNDARRQDALASILELHMRTLTRLIAGASHG